MVNRLTTLTSGYLPGDLSLFPAVYDDEDSLYKTTNNAETQLSQTLTYNSKVIYVESTAKFPSSGLLRLGPRSGPGNHEIVYYASKTDNTFQDLARGILNTTQTKWNLGSWVIGSVMAEQHNALADAIMNIETRLGVSIDPDPNSINGVLKTLEVKHLAPKAIFKAYPVEGPPSLSVRFQNTSSGDVINYLWDFGDGSTSIEKNPNHLYVTEGIFSVSLKLTTSTGSQASTIRSNLITVSNDKKQPFFYVVQKNVDDTGPISVATADAQSVTPGVFEFVDQTDGEIAQRYWRFGDGITESVSDPNIHTITHTYQSPGEYSPTLLVVYYDGNVKNVRALESLIVL